MATAQAVSGDPSLLHDEYESEQEDEEIDAHACVLCNSCKEENELECSRCKMHFCTKCSDIKKSEYKFLVKRVQNVYWFCTKCASKAKRCWESDYVVESSCATFLQETTKRIDDLETELKTKLDEMAKCVPSEMKKTWAQAVQDGKNMNCEKMEEKQIARIVQNVVEKQDKQTRDRTNRDLNIVIHRAEESETSMAENQKKHDQEFFSVLCEDILQVGDIPVENLIRMGKKQENRARPLKIILKDISDKRKIMMRLYNLKYAEDKFKRISVTDDLTYEEREEISKLVKEAQKRKREDTSGEYDYKVRGPSWNRRIIKIPIKAHSH